MSKLWKAQYEQPYLEDLTAENPPKRRKVITSQHCVKSLKASVFKNTAGRT